MLQNFYESLVTIVGRCIVDVVHACLKVETIFGRISWDMDVLYRVWSTEEINLKGSYIFQIRKAVVAADAAAAVAALSIFYWVQWREGLLL